MFNKYNIFLLIAVYYIFSYPVITTTWNLNYTIGWHSREFWTYLIPVWFVFVYSAYRALSARKVVISSRLFWTHVIISIVPSLYFNHPFIFMSGNTESVRSFDRLHTVNLAFKAYAIVQVLFLIHLYHTLRRTEMHTTSGL